MFDEKRYMLDGGTYTLSYFKKKKIVSQVLIIKKIVIIEKDCDY